MRVLIADDSPAVRQRLVLTLSRVEGVEVVCAACNGVEALACFEEHAPDLVILDIRMPELDGIEALRCMMRERADLLAIIITNSPSRGHRERCLELGAQHFFDKSTEFDWMIETVRRLVTGSNGPTSP